MTMKLKKRHRKKSSEQVNYWQSYSDLMSALLLMFMLITLAISLKANMDYENDFKEEENKKISLHPI